MTEVRHSATVNGLLSPSGPSSAISALSPELGGGARDTPKQTRKRIKGNVFLENGLVFSSDDEEFSIEFHNETQVEYRLNTMGHLGDLSNGFAIPRERFYFQGRLTKPIEYRVARLQEALTHDPRVLEQSLEVRVEGDRVILRGELVTPERCQAAITVAREVFPEATVVADLTVSPERRGDPDPERL